MCSVISCPFFGFVKSREKKIYYIPQSQYSSAWLRAAWPKFLQFRVSASVAVVPFVNPDPSSSLRCHPPLWRRPSPPADLPPADPPWASRCPPHPSASRLVGQVADAVEFWLCFPVFWHQSHSCVCSLFVIVSTLRSDNLFGL